MADINAIAKQFTDFYYNTFDSDRTQLAGLYRPQSMLTFEQDQIQGAEAIVGKLAGLPFQKIQHRVSTMDAQPASATEAAMVVLVTGQLLTGEEQNALSFSQVFHLRPEGGSYYVANDIFRLVYG
ncbi:nuclear transport factor 2 [Leucosporidium creatinivorum]|uniref:Nuclear transport factor 2 n=1 Tax=Leucosporidium creatinivorum TaxID=106004 RepID=A0A1Y2DRR7_9BASI|nr:nuclear transport factor 2 [Leucosporidium creatinivorum]